MDSRQIDTAMRNRTPVTYSGQKYVRILEYVSWYDNNGKRNLSAVLLADGNYTVRVPAEKVEIWDDCSENKNEKNARDVY